MSQLTSDLRGSVNAPRHSGHTGELSADGTLINTSSGKHHLSSAVPTSNKQRADGGGCSLLWLHLAPAGAGVGPQGYRCGLIAFEYFSFRSSALLAWIRLAPSEPTSPENSLRRSFPRVRVGGRRCRLEEMGENVLQQAQILRQVLLHLLLSQS